MRRNGRRALVTGGAGLIGSHIAGLLLAEGWSVRILDNLEPQTHLHGKPAWIPQGAEFIEADIREREAVTAALQGVDVVFHEAAYGGYMPEITKYFSVNSVGTAQMLEIIRDEKISIQKVVLASSQVVYPEGAGRCPEHGLVFPPARPVEQLRRGDFDVHCPRCSSPISSEPMPEEAPLSGGTVYALTKVDQERMVLAWGQQTGVPTVALRYACTYGPRQSIFNPYTGAIAIFSTRLLNGQPPVLYEDGNQTRDFCFVEDIARANLLAAETSALDGMPLNVGSGTATTVRELARLVSDALGIHIEPIIPGEFRPGEIRHLISDNTRIHSIGFTPQVGLATGIGKYVDWIRSQGDVREYFSAAESVLRAKRIVHRVCSGGL